MPILFVNKERVDVSANVPTDTPLLWILRDSLNLTGTKYGCGMALCGACTVHIEGQPVRSCQTPLSAIKQGADITTIEGLRTREGTGGGFRHAVRAERLRANHTGQRRYRPRRARRKGPSYGYGPADIGRGGARCRVDASPRRRCAGRPGPLQEPRVGDSSHRRVDR